MGRLLRSQEHFSRKGLTKNLEESDSAGLLKFLRKKNEIKELKKKDETSNKNGSLQQLLDTHFSEDCDVSGSSWEEPKQDANWNFAEKLIRRHRQMNSAGG